MESNTIICSYYDISTIDAIVDYGYNMFDIPKSELLSITPVIYNIDRVNHEWHLTNKCAVNCSTCHVMPIARITRNGDNPYYLLIVRSKITANNKRLQSIFRGHKIQCLTNVIVDELLI